MTRLASLIAASMVLAHGTAGAANGELDRARNAFAFGNYLQAIEILRQLLEPLRLRESDRIVEARQLLGVSYYFVKNFRAAEAEFERLLYLRPRHELDPLLFPPPVIELFEKVRARIKDKLARLHPEAKPPATGPVYIVRQVERRHLALSFFPFGIGQFQNQRPGKAAFFLAAEIATLAANLVTYAVAEGLRQPSGRFSVRDEGLVRDLRVVQIASLATFGALVVGGIVDALVEYRPEVVREERLPAPLGAPGSRGASRRLQFLPWMVNGGGGLDIALRF